MLLTRAAGASAMTFAWFYSPIFWNKKIRIALLTLATFAALC
jgi:hypothetical protein